MSRICIPYLAARMARRIMPEALARRFMSNDLRGLQHTLAIHSAQRDAANRLGLGIGGADIVELGPGRYNPASVGFLPMGAHRVTLIEHVRGELQLPLLSSRIAELAACFGADPEQSLRLSHCDPDETAQATSFGGGAIRFLWCSAADTGLPSCSVDAIFSNSVIEHLSDPASVLRECARVLVPGGVMFHRVDLRDHFFRYPLQFLCYSEPVWSKLLTSKSKHKAYLNRLRLPQIIDMLDGLGVSTEWEAIEANVDVAARARPHLAPEFAQFSDEDLGVLQVALYCRKRTELTQH